MNPNHCFNRCVKLVGSQTSHRTFFLSLGTRDQPNPGLKRCMTTVGLLFHEDHMMLTCFVDLFSL